MGQTKTVIIIAGPTAVGKTALAIEVAKHFETAIISADSRQCFQEMSIGVARPSVAELAAVPHYFIGTHSILQKVDARIFEAYALDTVQQLFQHHDVVVMTGGTGLYIKAFCEGLDDIPDIPADTRQKLQQEYEKYGLEWLQQEVQTHDPLYYRKGEIQNPQRLMRALEVAKYTGKSILTFHKENKTTRPFSIIKIGLEIPKTILHQQINKRVDQMISEGLVEEVEKLQAYQQQNALQTVGYKEIFEYLRGHTSLDTAIEEIKKNTRQYAKRQMTWFKKDLSFNWYHPADITALLEFLDKTVQVQE